jgi:hypothetical protein
MKRTLLATAAAFGLVAMALAPVAAAQFKMGGSGGNGGGGRPAGIQAGGPGRSVGMSAPTGGGSMTGGSVASQSFARAPSGNVATVQGGSQMSGKSVTMSGGQWKSGGQWNGNWSHHHHRRFFRPGFAFSVGVPYAYYDDSCYELQRILIRGVWHVRRVYVCDYDYDY